MTNKPRLISEGLRSVIVVSEDEAQGLLDGLHADRFVAELRDEEAN